MKRFAPSSASSFDFNSNTAYPPTTSLASVKGPSVVVSCPRETRMRVLIDVGASPPLAIIVPFLLASSPSLAMASISSLGGAAIFSADLTSIMNRIATPLLCIFVFLFQSCIPGRFRPGVQPCCTVTSNSGPQNRHERHHLSIPQFGGQNLGALRLGSCGHISAGILALSE